MWLTATLAVGAHAQALPGGTLDPTTVPKYVTPLVIPPVMDTACAEDDEACSDSYAIAMRQFQQQILPGGIWNTVRPASGLYGTDAWDFPATTVWGYGPADDPTPAIAPDANSQFNYPSYTLETLSDVPVAVEWRNELVVNPDGCNFVQPVGDPDCDYLPHLIPVDQTLHWANPVQECFDGVSRTDCAGVNPDPYTGPVPIITHVHGAHVDPHSDGYPEAWWLPAAGNIPAGYATSGTFYDDANGGAGNRGYSDFWYRQDQPATTLWYHDHALGMTRNNVYAGPAGFWLVRGGAYDGGTDTASGYPAVLPGPAAQRGQSVLDLNVPGAAVRNAVREIPIAIQDRSFNADGSLFYPDNRAFFEGLNLEGTGGTSAEQFPGAPELWLDFAPLTDIAPIWNPEAFFNTMVVNGVTWPLLEVADAKYRFRLLNGCDSRFLNLGLFVVNEDGSLGQELPFYQIGAEQGFLPQVVEIRTGTATAHDGYGGALAALLPPDQALLMSPAERADVIVDFGGLPDGTVVRLVNTGPDEPFGGFPVGLVADPGTTGQVMQFVVQQSLWVAADATTTDPHDLVLNAEAGPLSTTPATIVRQVSLNEMMSEDVCADEDPVGNVVQLPEAPPVCPTDEPFGPTMAVLGIVDPSSGAGIPLKWTDTLGMPSEVTLQSGAVLSVNVTENPIVGDTEDWEIYNFTVDAHPIHLHLVRFQVVSRRPIGAPAVVGENVAFTEEGLKDTVIAYPGEITTVRATFDVAGLYVWHCHIVEHEDNEMMRPLVVAPAAPDQCVVADDDLLVRDRGFLLGNVSAGDYFEVGADADVLGDARIGGDFFGRSNGLLDGDLVHGGAYATQLGFVLGGAATALEPVTPLLPVKTVTTGTKNVEVKAGVSATLTPGAYKKLTIRSNAKVTFQAGVYSYTSVTIEPDATLFVTDTTEINVSGATSFADRTKVLTSGTTGLKLYVGATTQVRIGTDATFEGSITAPNAPVVVSSRADVYGCIGGEDVTLEADALVDGGGNVLPGLEYP